MKDSEKLILALDVDTGRKAKYFINKLYPQIKVFKIGSQLFTACGPEIIKFVINKKAEVFLDLKFFDIPNTVACAVRQAVRLGVLMFTLHISGQEEMVRAAVSAVGEEAKRLKIRKPKVIGVTVLTSQEVNPDEILRLAKSGLKWGLDGVVCSARETGLLRKKLGKKFIIVTPGIRPRLSGKDDQKRVATAKESLRAGSSFLVVGRPILEAKDPLRAAKEIF